MKSLLYILRRYKLASSLNLLGLVVAFAATYVLLTQIRYIDTYNQGIKGHEQIHRLYVRGLFYDEWNTTFMRPYLEKLKTCPQVESVGYLRYYGDMELDKEGSLMTTSVSLCSNDLLTTMNTELVDGTLPHESDAFGAFIPASLSEKYFGTAMSAGKEMKLGDGRRFVIQAVYRDFPSNSVMSNVIYMPMGNENIDNTNNWNYKAFVRLRSDANVETFEGVMKKQLEVMLTEKLKNIPPEHAAEADEAKQRVNETIKRLQFMAMPLSETYLHGYDADTDTGDVTTLYILKLAVVLLILVALINFNNFNTALSPIRMRSINTRRVMGESTLSLRMGLVGEGIFVSLLAFALAMLVVYCLGLWPYVGQFTLASVRLQDNWLLVSGMALLSVGCGVLGTLYSARYVTSFQPALVLKGNFGLSARGRVLRQVLVAMQFVLAFTLVVFVGVMFAQHRYISTSDYGYDKDVLLFGDFMYDFQKDQKEALRSELEKVVGVESVAFSGLRLGMYDRCMEWTRGSDGQEYTSKVVVVDWKMLRTCGIEIIEGRDFKETDKDVYIINETMKKRYPDIEMDKLLCRDDMPVIGVCRNFRIFTTRVDNNATPVAFVIFGDKYADWGDPAHTLYVRIAQNVDKAEVRKRINAVLASFVKKGNPPELKFLDERMEESYYDEMRFMKQIEASTLLLIAIAIIGVFCLTMFETEYRRKEIAIRKVMGSSVGEVLLLFTQRYALPLVISFALAAPLGYYLSLQWLQNFAEHTPIHWWIFVLAFVLVSTIVLLTVVVQSWRVATKNPIESIKTE